MFCIILLNVFILVSALGILSSVQVKYNYFYTIFTEKFNIAFGTPATDVCSTCLRLKEEIKAARADNNMKLVKEQKAMLKFHKTKARGFYTLMRNSDPKAVSYCFDLQQVQYLPRISIGEAFYKRQLAYYAFCVCHTEPDRDQDATFYSWLQTEGKRGTEEIGSALIHHLNAQKASWNENSAEPVRTLHLFCDGCGGQNKNRHIIHALAFWLYNDAPPNVTKIMITFPVRGHSFLPADRVFGRVEQDLHRAGDIILPKDYHRIYSKHGNVRVVNQDWHIQKFKDVSQYMVPLTGLQQIKRLVLKKEKDSVYFKMEVNYFSSDKTKRAVDIMKKKYVKELTKLIRPAVNNTPLPLPPKLKEDLKELLEARFGKNWCKSCTPLKFYQDAMKISGQTVEETDEVICDCLLDDDSV